MSGAVSAPSGTTRILLQRHIPGTTPENYQPLTKENIIGIPRDYLLKITKNIKDRSSAWDSVPGSIKPNLPHGMLLIPDQNRTYYLHFVQQRGETLFIDNDKIHLENIGTLINSIVSSSLVAWAIAKFIEDKMSRAEAAPLSLSDLRDFVVTYRRIIPERMLNLFSEYLQKDIATSNPSQLIHQLFMSEFGLLSDMVTALSELRGTNYLDYLNDRERAQLSTTLHDIYTPLTIMYARLYLIKVNTKGNHEARLKHHKIIAATLRVLTMNTLSLGNLLVGNQNYAELFGRMKISEILDLVASATGFDENTIRIDIPDDLEGVLMNNTYAMIVIIQNVLSNAYKYSLSEPAQEFLQKNGRPKADHVLISVGFGFDMNTCQRSIQISINDQGLGLSSGISITDLAKQEHLIDVPSTHIGSVQIENRLSEVNGSFITGNPPLGYSTNITLNIPI